MVKRHIKWGVHIIALNDTDFLEATIRMFQPFVDKIVISIGEKGWFGDIKNDGSAEKIIKSLTDEFNNIKLIKGIWETETEQRNDTMYYLNECEYIFIVDADEMWSSGDIVRTKEYVESKQSYNIFRANWNTRFKNINWRVDPKEPFKPIVVVKKRTKFTEHRDVKSTEETSSTLIPEQIALIEHFSYLRSDDEKIKEKISTFSHANDIVGGVNMWYEEVYLQANLDSKNLHPTNPKCYSKLVEDKIDPEIMKFLKKYSPKLFKDE